MKIFEALTEKPWINEPSLVEGYSDNYTPRKIPEKIALRFFLSAVTVLFFLFIITFLSRSQFSDFQALAGEPWQPFTQSWQLWFNTGLLMCASIFLHWGLIAARKDQLNLCVSTIIFAGLLTLLFILAQLWVWQQLMAQGYYVASNPANSFYYLLTSLHGLHLAGGLFVLSKVVLRFWQGVSLEKIANSLGLCTTYWHYLFVVWLVLFALLTSTSETFNTIAALCGF